MGQKLMGTTFNGFQFYNAFLSGYINISSNREYINQINVFPVQDGDTGTNMVGTFKIIAENLVPCRATNKLLNNIASLSLEGARGNSGMIISQYLNAFARYAGNNTSLSLCQIGSILQESVKDAYAAVETPREGTMLTVMRVWATVIARECANSKNLEEILTTALSAAQDALKKTPEQLAVLKKYHVVDAGAWGFVSFLEGIVKLGEHGRVSFSKRKELKFDAVQISKQLVSEVHSFSGEIPYRYCTEVLLEGTNIEQAELKKLLKPLGDSLIVSAGAYRSRIHIHTNEPSIVIAKLRKLGKIVQQKADDMIRQEEIINKRLSSIGVVTDSIADIPQEILDAYQIHVINLSLIWDGEEYLDKLTIKPQEFYKMQSIKDSFPTSSFPSAAKIERYYQYLLEHYEGLIVLPVAKQLSGTWQRLSLSSEQFNKGKKRVEVIDTCLNSVAQGLLIKNIAEKAAQGASLEELVTISEELKKRIKIFVTVKTFKFMVKGGRVSPLKGFIGKVLNLKPIVSLDENGKGIAFDKSFSSKGLMKKIARIVKTISNTNGIQEYAVVHALAPEQADNFVQVIQSSINKSPAYISDISPIVGMHSGKGAVAIAVIENVS
jgi:DegV family protein with EDD domain